MAKTPRLQRHLRIDEDDTIMMRMMTPAQWKQRRLRIDESDNPILSMETTPAWWLCLLNYSRDTVAMRVTIAIATTAKMPAHQQHQCHRDECNNAIATTARTPAHQSWQQCHCNKGTMPAWVQQGCHHDKGNNAFMDLGQQCHCYDGDGAIYTMARMLAHQQWQQHHCHEGNNCNRNNGRNPAHWWQQCHHDKGNDASLMTRNEGNDASSRTAETRLCIDNGNNAIMTRVTIAIRTMAKTPPHRQQWCQLDNKQWGQQHGWSQQNHCNKGSGASLKTATTPLQIKGNNAIVTRATMPA